MSEQSISSKKQPLKTRQPGTHCERNKNEEKEQIRSGLSTARITSSILALFAAYSCWPYTGHSRNAELKGFVSHSSSKKISEKISKELNFNLHS
ncbi:hypothetical protein L1887_61440 [Cichorium endivia]|nr:hypothetical protein L1887_61440 [Cichorium endivia]